MKFKLETPMKPAGDQPKAIAGLNKSLKSGYKNQTLLGVTGSGKTFTMANVIEQIQKPTLIICHNKTLAAQLASEFQGVFPDNAIHYFVSNTINISPKLIFPVPTTTLKKTPRSTKKLTACPMPATNRR